MKRFFPLILPFVFVTPVTCADEENHGIVSNTLVRAHEFFNTTLPGTMGVDDLTIEFQPKVGDFVNREFIRFPVTLRYGIAPGWETIAGWTPVSPNPFKSGPDNRWGPGEYRLGVRHDLHPWIGFFDQITVGLDFRGPLGRPPFDLLDGYARIKPFLALAKPLDPDETILLFLNVRYDYSVPPPFNRSAPRPGIIKRHEFDITPGVIYKPGELGYFVDYTLRFIDEPGDNRRANIYTAGLIWDPPEERTRGFGLPGDWQFDIGYQLTDEQERSVRHSIQLRARWRGTFREVVRWSERVLP